MPSASSSAEQRGRSHEARVANRDSVVTSSDDDSRSSGDGKAKTGMSRDRAARRPGPGPKGRRPRGDGRQPDHRAEDQLLDSEALAHRLNITERFVKRLVAERRIPFLKVGRSVRFDPIDVDAWVEQAKVPVTAWRHACGPWDRGGAE